MTENWIIFERNAIKFLRNNIRIGSITFKSVGGRDSTKTDIEVMRKGRKLFAIEAKLLPPQSGQFVILLKNRKYVYSPKNKEAANEYSNKIVERINANIARYANCGTSGKAIDCSESILSKWVIAHYRNRDVEFIITSDSPSNFGSKFIRAIPLKNVENQFETTAILRCKRSGTERMPKKYKAFVHRLLASKFGSNFSLSENGDVKFLKGSPKECYLGEMFFLAKEGARYIVKKRSGTNNPNVIFSLKYLGEKKTGGFEELKKEIEKRFD